MKNETYEEFVEKFKPKLTTDDCMTPPQVYDAVRDWVCRKYGVIPEKIIRPFWPGGDYENFAYPDDCIVLDNPPFSIVSKICEFYCDRGIGFFLFAPSLTAFTGKRVCMRMNHIICDASITYENGASVKTAFVTNLGDGDIIAQTAPELGETIKRVMKNLYPATNLPKYEFPDHILTAAMMQKYAQYGIDLKIRRKDCALVKNLDSQREKKKKIFGGGLLLSDSAAAEKKAAEKMVEERKEKKDGIKWPLSDREKEIIAKLG